MIKYKHRTIGLFVFIAVLMLCFTPLTISAAGAQKVELNASGSEAELIMDFPQAAAEEIASMQISLNVTAASGTNVEFIFDSALSSKITEARYHSDTGVLNIYIAGTEALFPKNSPLTVGKVKLSGSGASASVSVIENSIKFVRGSELVSPSDVSYPQAVTVTSGSSTSSSSSTVGSSSTSSSSSLTSSSSSTPSSSQTPSSSSSTPSSSASSVPENNDDPMVTLDTAALLSALERAESYKRGDYTEDSYNALSEAINSAKAILSDINASQNDIDDALLELENSLAMLVLKNEAPTENNSSDSNSSSSVTESSPSDNSSADAEDTDSSVLIWVIAAVMAVLLAAFVSILVVIKRKGRK